MFAGKGSEWFSLPAEQQDAFFPNVQQSSQAQLTAEQQQERGQRMASEGVGEIAVGEKESGAEQKKEGEKERQASSSRRAFSRRDSIPWHEGFMAADAGEGTVANMRTLVIIHEH